MSSALLSKLPYKAIAQETGSPCNSYLHKCCPKIFLPRKFIILNMANTAPDISTNETMERIYPESFDPQNLVDRMILEMHNKRYNFAAKNLRGTNILDIACGSGYGSEILANSNKKIHITGVDKSKQAIKYARNIHSLKNLSFIKSDALKFRPKSGFDTIVSLETIEHLPEPGKFIDHLIKILNHEGLVIASVPITPSVDVNYHHLNDFNETSYTKMFIERGFKAKKRFYQDQTISPLQIINKRSQRFIDIRKNLLSYYLNHPTSFLKRVISTLKFGFKNRYLTIVWEKID